MPWVALTVVTVPGFVVIAVVAITTGAVGQGVLAAAFAALAVVLAVLRGRRDHQRARRLGRCVGRPQGRGNQWWWRGAGCAGAAAAGPSELSSS